MTGVERVMRKSEWLRSYLGFAKKAEEGMNKGIKLFMYELSEK